MKELFIKALSALNNIGKDKYMHFYMHFVGGVLIAAVSFIGCVVFSLAPAWAVLIGLVISAGAGALKEWVVDEQATFLDFYYTLVGGGVVAVVVWVALIAQG